MDTCVENVQSLTVIISIQLKLTLGRAKGNGTGKSFLSLFSRWVGRSKAHTA